MGELLEDYLTAQSSKSGRTSNHTLKGKLSEANVISTSPPSVETTVLFSDYHDYWLKQLNLGFNILLYGVGSKISILQKFCEKVLVNSCHLFINGFFSGLTLKHVLTLISSEVLGHSGKFKTDLDHTNYIKKALKAKPKDIFLIIHNIDGLSLRSVSAQTCLSSLAQSQCIHILASIDHINAPLMWDQKLLSHYNWLWFDTSTFKPYTQEGAYEKSLLVEQSGLNSLVHVMQGLTPNARGIFRLLAKYQLDKKNSSEVYLGIPFDDCYLKCREKFLVNSDLTLRTQLTEFHDHKLMKSHPIDGVEYLMIYVEDSILTQFIEQHNEE